MNYGRNRCHTPYISNNSNPAYPTPTKTDSSLVGGKSSSLLGTWVSSLSVIIPPVFLPRGVVAFLIKNVGTNVATIFNWYIRTHITCSEHIIYMLCSEQEQNKFAQGRAVKLQNYPSLMEHGCKRLFYFGEKISTKSQSFQIAYNCVFTVLKHQQMSTHVLLTYFCFSTAPSVGTLNRELGASNNWSYKLTTTVRLTPASVVRSRKDYDHGAHPQTHSSPQYYNLAYCALHSALIKT